MNRKELTILMIIFSVVSIIVHSAVGVSYNNTDWLSNLILMLWGALVFYAVLMSAFKKTKMMEWEAKELNPEASYIFSVKEPLTSEEFDKFVKAIRKHYKNKNNIIVNGNAIDVELNNKHK